MKLEKVANLNWGESGRYGLYEAPTADNGEACYAVRRSDGKVLYLDGADAERVLDAVYATTEGELPPLTETRRREAAAIDEAMRPFADSPNWRTLREAGFAPVRRALDRDLYRVA